jgi:hypothetical protein
MMTEAMTRELTEALPGRIERQIAQRTWGRLRHLSIDVSEERVRVQGCAPSYYLKQLAIQACLEATEPAGAPRLDVDIVVAGEGLLPVG